MIQLPNGYVLDADQFQYIVGKPRERINSKTGEKEIIIAQGSYHPTMEKALISLSERLKREAIANSDGTLKEAVHTLSSVSHAFAKDIREVFGDSIEVIVHNPEVVKEHVASSKLRPSA